MTFSVTDTGSLDREAATCRREKERTMNHVIEWAPFTLAEGADEQTVLAASEALQRNFLDHQPGFLSRELLRLDDRRWVDLVHWTSREAADAAMTAAASSTACKTYFGCMVLNEHDPAGVVTILERVRTYGD